MSSELEQELTNVKISKPDWEHRFNSLLQNSLELIMVINKDNEFSYVSPGVIKALDYQIDEILGRPYVDFIHTESIDFLEKTITNALSKPGKAFPFDNLTAYHKNASLKILKGTVCRIADTVGAKDVVLNAVDITEFKKKEENIEKKELNQRKINKVIEDNLNEKTIELEEMNAALKVLLKKREDDKLEIEERIFSNFNMVIIPFFNKLKTILTQENQKYLVNILESELKNILSPFSKKLSDPLINLTPTEIIIAELIKLGKSNKKIAEILNSSIHTISRHRESIRTKLGLKNTKINLRRYLSTLC